MGLAIKKPLSGLGLVGFASDGYARRVRVRMTIIAILAKLLVLPLYAGMWYVFYFVGQEMGGSPAVSAVAGLALTLGLLLEDSAPARIMRLSPLHYWRSTARPARPRRLR